jgi:hypothetical protein
MSPDGDKLSLTALAIILILALLMIVVAFLPIDRVGVCGRGCHAVTVGGVFVVGCSCYEERP